MEAIVRGVVNDPNSIEVLASNEATVREADERK
jgi:hypothetical protein